MAQATTTPHLSEIVIYPIKSLRGISVPRVALEREGLAFDRRWMLINDKNRFVTQREIPKLCLFQPELTPVEAPALGTRQASRLPGAALIVRPPPSSALPPLRVPLEPEQASSRTATVWGFSGDVLDEGDEAAAWFSAALAELGGGAGGAARSTAVRLVKHAPQLPQGTRTVDPSFALPGTTTAFADEYPVLAATEGSLADLNKRLGNALPMSRFRPNLVFAGGEASDAPWADDGWARVRVCSEQQGGAVDFEYVKPCSRCKVTTVDPSTGEVGGGGEGGQKLPAGDHEPLRALRGFRTGAALGWEKKRPAFKHAVFFAWNVQPVVVEEGDGAGGGGGRVVALGAGGQQQEEKNDDGDATWPPPLAVLERGSRVEVVARRKWE